MTYGSTRGGVKGKSFSECVLMGIAPDGGLFVPEKDVLFDSLDLAGMSEMNYRELACEIFKYYATDFTEDEISQCVEAAYGKDSAFPEDTAPLHKLSDTLSVLELWHGPTAAFKDYALQIMPHFMSTILQRRSSDNKKKHIAILTATSGDTGKAALEGYKDKENIKIIVFYPVNGVSEMQKRQMVTQEGSNLRVVAVDGNFDDAQTGVKKIFANKALAQELQTHGISLSSANSINIGRLLPQIVYYFYSYFSYIKSNKLSLGSKINYVVPTGNFGDILACYYAAKSGLPIKRIICATNENNVVSSFLSTGVYNRNRQFYMTASPAMDILVSSNLERLLYDMSGYDYSFVMKNMESLSGSGIYTVDKKTRNNINGQFWSSYSNDEDTFKTIDNIYQDYKYLIDTHTAVGIDVYDKYVISTGDATPTIAVSTASPFKFNKSVTKALFGDESTQGHTEFELLDILSEKTCCPIPRPLVNLDEKQVTQSRTCNRDGMLNEVRDFLI